MEVVINLIGYGPGFFDDSWKVVGRIFIRVCLRLVGEFSRCKLGPGSFHHGGNSCRLCNRQHFDWKGCKGTPDFHSAGFVATCKVRFLLCATAVLWKGLRLL